MENVAEQPATLVVDDMKPFVDAVIAGLKRDPGLAWSYHCNIAMAAVDEGVDHATANHAAARFMRLWAGVEPAHELPAKQPPARSLPGDRGMWFDPATLPPRDKYGYTHHDDLSLRIWHDGDPADEAPLAKQAFEDMELEIFVDGGEDFERYDNWNAEIGDFGDAESGCTRWKPEPPAGDGWRLAAIYDTEDGPAAMWVRDKL